MIDHNKNEYSQTENIDKTLFPSLEKVPKSTKPTNLDEGTSMINLEAYKKEIEENIKNT